MDDRFRTDALHTPVSGSGSSAEAAEQLLTSSEQDRNDGKMEFIDQPRFEILPDGGGTPADADVLTIGCFGGRFERYPRLSFAPPVAEAAG